MRGAFFEAALLVAAALVAVASASLCRQGQTWWSPEKDTCLNCTDCNSVKTSLVVLRPCEVHQDTVCAPLVDLHLDWSWLARASNDRRHAKFRKDHRKKHQDPDHKNDTPKNDDKHRKIVWRFSTLSDEDVGDVKYENRVPNDQKIGAEVTNGVKEFILDNDEEEDLPYADSQHIDGYTDYDSDMEVRLEREPLVSDFDDFVWDWQSMVLTMAAFACILFFMVVAVYSVYHARQWRILKENLEADVEGLSAKINLMMASAETNDLPEPPSPGVENQYSNNCAYLEQLLVGKGGKGRTSGPGNVYIQESNSF